MARAILGVAIVQALLGIAMATATPTASQPDDASRVLLFSVVFTALWLTSANFFRIASKREVAARQARLQD